MSTRKSLAVTLSPRQYRWVVDQAQKREFVTMSDIVRMLIDNAIDEYAATEEMHADMMNRLGSDLDEDHDHAE